MAIFSSFEATLEPVCPHAALARNGPCITTIRGPQSCLDAFHADVLRSWLWGCESTSNGSRRETRPGRVSELVTRDGPHPLSYSLVMTLLADADDAAGGAGASVARLLGLLVATLSEVVGASVGDDGALWDNGLVRFL